MQARKLKFQDQIWVIMLKFCLGCRDLHFSEQFYVSRAAISNMFHIFIVCEHCMNYLKELCLEGFYSKNTGSINFVAKIKEEEYMCINLASATSCHLGRRPHGIRFG